MSDKVPETSGVLQDTVLGPILFLIHIHDFADYIKYRTLRPFADDSIIYKNIHNLSNFQHLQLNIVAAG
ncbi:hypothetical protein DPMN_006240 [Dreissena polymorpha]|uniref:Reverse transcriptase domain-containing protein n=1 Tax=Dreissena polymorpha TaxID=45954 RepID=A0A9D4MS17_DREPO|nr:hypothetical protein DPMN_006240 [Dreissena polymorpha]